MPLRPLAVAAFIFIFVMIGIFEIYHYYQVKHIYYRLNLNYSWVGIIDMDYDHGIDIAGIINGNDVILLVDNQHPDFQRLVQEVKVRKSQLDPDKVHTTEYDTDQNGILDIADPVSQFFRILIFVPERKGYQLRTLHQAGIRAIQLDLGNKGHNKVILSDGSRRTIYEIHKPGGTSMYRTIKGTEIKAIPYQP